MGKYIVVSAQIQFQHASRSKSPGRWPELPWRERVLDKNSPKWPYYAVLKSWKWIESRHYIGPDTVVCICDKFLVRFLHPLECQINFVHMWMGEEKICKWGGGGQITPFFLSKNSTMLWYGTFCMFYLTFKRHEKKVSIHKARRKF